MNHFEELQKSKKKPGLGRIVQMIEKFLKVETKDSRVVRFVLNVIQRSFIRQVADIIKNNPNRPLRLIILKGRQFGFSTLILAWFFIRCLLVPNTRAAVVSHESEATKKLFRRVHFFAKTLLVKATLDTESQREYSFPLTNSYFYIGTAGTKAFGRGDNLTHVHCSEVAFWGNPGIMMNGLTQAVGKTGTIIIETTANGIGDYFYKLWRKSYRNPDSAWSALFFKWTEFKEYELEPRADFRRTEEEQIICRHHPEMNNKKLSWRRWKINETETEPGFTPEMIFKQEYPLTPREAFVASGDTVYDVERLEDQEAKKPERIGDLGELIWLEPSKYGIMSYMGIDVAEGLENKDRTIIDIYNHKLEQVCHWAGWIDPDEGADLAIKLAIRYKSYIVPEANSMGVGLVNKIAKKYNKGLIYRREVFDTARKMRVKKYGWKTSRTTKAILIGAMIEPVRELSITFNNWDTLEEMMAYVKDGKGGFTAPAGANDDRVIASCLALQGYLDKPPSIKFKTIQAEQKENIEIENKKWRANKKKKAKQKARLKRLR